MAGPTPSPSLAGRVMRSSLWMMLNSAIIRLISFATQIALSFALAKSDFGVYALSVSVAALLTNFRGGGMLQWLIQGGRDKFDERAGAAFWTSLLFNSLLGLTMAAVARPAGGFFGSDEVPLLLVVSGLSFPLSTFSSYYKTTMSIDLRMREVTTIEAVSALLRGVLTVILAFAGLGPLSFVLPLPISYVVEGVMGYLRTLDRAWRRRMDLRSSPHLVWRNRWILAGTFLTTIGLQADYAVLGRFVSLSVVGVYYFAYQMTFMSAALVTENARRVLVPGLVAVPVERRPEAALRATTAYMAIGAPVLMVLGCCIQPLQALIWGGKWVDAVAPIELFSLMLPMQLLTVITTSTLQSDGKFRLWTLLSSVRALFVVVGALIAASFFPTDNTAIALVMTLAFTAANLVQVWIAFARRGVRIGRVMKAAGSGIILAPVALVVARETGEVLGLPPLADLTASVAVFTVLYLVLAYVFDRDGLVAARSAIRSAVAR